MGEKVIVDYNTENKYGISSNIKSGRIFFAPLIKFCEFLEIITWIVEVAYRYVFKKPLNLKNPQDLNEKILNFIRTLQMDWIGR